MKKKYAKPLVTVEALWHLQMLCASVSGGLEDTYDDPINMEDEL